MFIVDSQFITPDSPPHYLNRLEPLTLLSALAVATEHIGLVGTLTTSFNQPFNLVFSSETSGAEIRYTTNGSPPTVTNALYTGPLEETNESYAVAKLAGIAQLVAIRRQHGLPYICAMPTKA